MSLFHKYVIRVEDNIFKTNDAGLATMVKKILEDKSKTHDEIIKTIDKIIGKIDEIVKIKEDQKETETMHELKSEEYGKPVNEYLEWKVGDSVKVLPGFSSCFHCHCSIKFGDRLINEDEERSMLDSIESASIVSLLPQTVNFLKVGLVFKTDFMAKIGIPFIYLCPDHVKHTIDGHVVSSTEYRNYIPGQSKAEYRKMNSSLSDNQVATTMEFSAIQSSKPTEQTSTELVDKGWTKEEVALIIENLALAHKDVHKKLMDTFGDRHTLKAVEVLCYCLRRNDMDRLSKRIRNHLTANQRELIRLYSIGVLKEKAKKNK